MGGCYVWPYIPSCACATQLPSTERFACQFGLLSSYRVLLKDDSINFYCPKKSLLELFAAFLDEASTRTLL